MTLDTQLEARHVTARILRNPQGGSVPQSTGWIPSTILRAPGRSVYSQQGGSFHSSQSSWRIPRIHRADPQDPQGRSPPRSTERAATKNGMGWHPRPTRLPRLRSDRRRSVGGSMGGVYNCGHRRGRWTGRRR